MKVHGRLLYLSAIALAGMAALLPVRASAQQRPFGALLVDLDNDGLLLTNAASGVVIRGRRTGWTAAGARDAFLAFDRNGNGRIDDIGELLNSSFVRRNKQPALNGFDAIVDLYLSLETEKGGVLDERDVVYPALRLWIDANHDARCDDTEVASLPAMMISAIRTQYLKLNKPQLTLGNLITHTGAARQSARGLEFLRTISYVVFDAQ